MINIRVPFVAALALLFVSGFSVAREQLQIVGSSTVYPFASFVAEEFGALSRYPTPVVEATGTGGGIKIFCAGNGMELPDIVNASRRIRIMEMQLCRRNGVSNITEVMFGYDGIVLAQNAEMPPLKLTMHELLLALAKMVPNESGNGLVENTYTHWNQINPALPNRKITVYGPPISSGTRDSFEEIVLEVQTEKMKVYRDAGLKGYRVIRTDGVFVPAGENDNLIVQKLTKDRNAMGIFGYSYLAENSDIIQSIAINDVSPSTKTIASKEYPIARSLFFYVKNDHHQQLPALREYIDMFMSPEIVGENGLLVDIGLIPMKDDLITRYRQRAEAREVLDIRQLERTLAAH